MNRATAREYFQTFGNAALSNFGVAAAGIGQYSIINKFGKLTTLTNTEEDIWTPGGAYNFATMATNVAIHSLDAGDASGSTGALSVKIVGLNENWEDTEETLTLDSPGTPAISTQAYQRIFRAFVVSAGTYGGNNVGDLVIHQGDATAVTLAAIDAGRGQTQMAIYTIPAGKTGWMTEFDYSVDSAKTADFYMYRRENADSSASAPFGAKRLIYEVVSVSEQGKKKLDVPVSIPEKTDIWMAAKGSAAGADVVGNFTILLTDN
jgi:hypothetical protein